MGEGFKRVWPLKTPTPESKDGHSQFDFRYSESRVGYEKVEQLVQWLRRPPFETRTKVLVLMAPSGAGKSYSAHQLALSGRYYVLLHDCSPGVGFTNTVMKNLEKVSYQELLSKDRSQRHCWAFKVASEELYRRLMVFRLAYAISLLLLVEQTRCEKEIIQSIQFLRFLENGGTAQINSLNERLPPFLSLSVRSSTLQLTISPLRRIRAGAFRRLKKN